MCGQLKFQMPARPPIGRPDRTYLRHPTGGAGARWCSEPWTKAHSSPAASTQEPPSDHALQSPRGACPARLTVPACAPPCVLPHDRHSAPLHVTRYLLLCSSSLAPPEAKLQARLASFQLRVLYVSSCHTNTRTHRISPLSPSSSPEQSPGLVCGASHTQQAQEGWQNMPPSPREEAALEWGGQRC